MSETPQPKTRGWRRWAWRLGEAILILALVLAVRAYQQRGLAAGPAPALQGVLLDGKTASLAALRGRPVLVHFWGTWCPVCRLEQGSINAIARRYPVITVALQSGSAAEVQGYLARHHLGFPVLNDPDGRIAARWGVRAVPASFVIGPRGDIRYAEVGYTTSAGLRLRLWLAGL